MNKINQFKDIYITGDIHGNLNRIKNFIDRFDINSEDYAIIVLGDFGLLWERNPWAKNFKINLYEDKYKCHIFWIDGNHENFDLVKEIPIDKETGFGFVSQHIHYLPRGFIFRPEVETISMKILCCGGADSVDKIWRKEGLSWWPQEAISLEDIKKVKEGDYDFVLTHCCGYDTFAQYKNILISHNQLKDTGDHLSEKNLQKILDKINYGKHFFGHYHVDCTLDDKHMCLYDRFVSLLDEYNKIKKGDSKKIMNKERYFKISETQLKDLLESSLKLDQLYADGVDNWEWYGEGREQFIANCLGCSIKEVEENDYYWEDVVNKELESFEVIE